MVKVYYSSKRENIYWKIYTDNINNSVFYFPENASIEEVLNKLTQSSLFEVKESKINVINISDWKLSNKSIKSQIEELSKLESEIILVLEANTIKTKLFSELNIQTVKSPNITRKAKTDVVSFLLAKAKITLDFEGINLLLDLLPDDINFITNEIEKLRLLGLKQLTSEQIKKNLFDVGEATIFKVIDAWLANDQEKAINELNNLLSGNFDILEILPMFAYKLVQIKLFLKAKLAKWSSDMITSKLGIPFWLQNSYANLRPYDKNLKKINMTISKFYNFDITIKKNNINKKDSVPYAQLIKILFE